MEIRDAYNRIGFLAPAIIEACDLLEETTAPQRQLKYHLKRLNMEAQKVVDKHFKLYENHGDVTQPDGSEIDTENIYNITAKAYDFLISKKPHEIASIADIVRRMDADGVDYTQISIAYDPLQK